MEQAQVDVEEVKPPMPSSSWRDFTLDEHIRAYVGCPAGCQMIIKEIGGDRYRVNVLRISTNSGDAHGTTKFEKSAMISVKITPDGPIISTMG